MILESSELEGKVVLVTGCNKGIGRACAEALVEAGAEILRVYRSGKMEEVAKTFGELGHSFKAYACGFGKRESWYAFRVLGPAGGFQRRSRVP